MYYVLSQGPRQQKLGGRDTKLAKKEASRAANNSILCSSVSSSPATTRLKLFQLISLAYMALGALDGLRK